MNEKKLLTETLRLELHQWTNLLERLSSNETHISIVVVEIDVLYVDPFLEVRGDFDVRRDTLLHYLCLDIPITAARKRLQRFDHQKKAIRKFDEQSRRPVSIRAKGRSSQHEGYNGTQPTAQAR